MSNYARLSTEEFRHMLESDSPRAVYGIEEALQAEINEARSALHKAGATAQNEFDIKMLAAINIQAGDPAGKLRTLYGHQATLRAYIMKLHALGVLNP